MREDQTTAHSGVVHGPDQLPTYASTAHERRCVVFYSGPHGGWFARYPQYDETPAHWSAGPFETRGLAQDYADACNAYSASRHLT